MKHTLILLTALLLAPLAASLAVASEESSALRRVADGERLGDAAVKNIGY